MIRLRIYSAVLMLLLIVLMTACGEQEVESEEAQATETGAGEVQAGGDVEETAVPLDTGTVDDQNLQLSERTTFASAGNSEFEYSIAHPADWLVSTAGPYTIIHELEEDSQNEAQGSAQPAKGYWFSFEHRDLDFMRGMGLPAEPTLQDLYELNKGFFEWPDTTEATETEVIGVPALLVTISAGPAERSLMGFVDEEAFLLIVGAPSEEAMELFLPTWEEMLQSIEAGG